MNLGKTLDDEVEHLRCELGELRQLLHESHEKESMAEGEAGTARNEVSSLRKELETWQGHEVRDPQVEQLREEVKRLELQLLERSIEQEFVQAKVELEVHRAVESERRKWEEERKLLNKMVEEKQRSVVPVSVTTSGNCYKQWRPNEPMSVGNVSNTADSAGVDTVNKVSTMNSSITEGVSNIHFSSMPMSTYTTTSASGQVADHDVTPHVVYSHPCNVPLMESDVRPHLEYRVQLWCPCILGMGHMYIDISVLERVQMHVCATKQHS